MQVTHQLPSIPTESLNEIQSLLGVVVHKQSPAERQQVTEDLSWKQETSYFSGPLLRPLPDVQGNEGEIIFSK